MHDPTAGMSQWLTSTSQEARLTAFALCGINQLPSHCRGSPAL